jgi:hypothetical protein
LVIDREEKLQELYDEMKYLIRTLEEAVTIENTSVIHLTIGKLSKLQDMIDELNERVYR